MDYSFGKRYKLCSKIEIDEVLNRGNSEKRFPFVCKYKLAQFEERTPFQIVISAPKRTFKSAVERNRIKRICREAVRVNKHILESWLVNNEKQLALFLIYYSKDELSVEQLKNKVKRLFEQIIEQLKTN